MYNRLKTASIAKKASKKIKDRGIMWRENYKDKSLSFKQKMDALVGKDSYLRFTGHDVTTNCDYYIVIGPSVDNGQKKFFAGIKKLPREANKKVYSPYGEYFGTILSAIAYANKKWGLPFKSGVPAYNMQTLANIDIPEHIKG